MSRAMGILNQFNTQNNAYSLFRNYQRRAEELDKMKAEYDTRNVAGGHSAWAKFSLVRKKLQLNAYRYKGM